MIKMSLDLEDKGANGELAAEEVILMFVNRVSATPWKHSSQVDFEFDYDDPDDVRTMLESQGFLVLSYTNQRTDTKWSRDVDLSPNRFRGGVKARRGRGK